MLVRLNPWDRQCVATIDPQRVKSVHEESAAPKSPAEQLRSDVAWIVALGERGPKVRWLTVSTNDGGSWTLAMPADEDIEQVRQYFGDPIAWDAMQPEGVALKLRVLPDLNDKKPAGELAEKVA